MARVLAIDYGRKRCGIAVTDILQIAANGLPTVPTHLLWDFLMDYVSKEPVERIILGEPRQSDGTHSESMKYIKPFFNRLRKQLPDIAVELVDERYTSVIAHREMIAGGFKKSDRSRKGFADEMAAVIILTQWLQNKDFRFNPNS